jgi:hypothetical protein
MLFEVRSSISVVENGVEYTNCRAFIFRGIWGILSLTLSSLIYGVALFFSITVRNLQSVELNTQIPSAVIIILTVFGLWHLIITESPEYFSQSIQAQAWIPLFLMTIFTMLIEFLPKLVITVGNKRQHSHFFSSESLHSSLSNSSSNKLSKQKSLSKQSRQQKLLVKKSSNINSISLKKTIEHQPLVHNSD